MSHSTIERDQFAKYAPRWLREGTTKPADAMTLPPAQQLPKLRSDQPPWHGPSPFDGDVRPWRTGELPEQEIVAIAPSLVPNRARTGVVERAFWTAAILSVAVSAAGAVGVFLFPHGQKNEIQTDNSSLVSTDSSQVSQREKSPITKSTARLGASDADPIDLTPATDGARIAAAEKPVPQVANAVYAVAPSAVAATEVLPSTQTQSQPRVQTGSLAPLQARGHHGLSADEIGRITSRGEAYLAQGDVAAARVLLGRAAEARDARAALVLGSTYDPNVLKSMGVVGIQPDPDQAQAWYKRAAEYGSDEASQRLTALAQAGH